MANGDKKKQIKAYMKEAKRDIRGKAPKDAGSLASYQVEKGTGPFSKPSMKGGSTYTKPKFSYQGGKPQLLKDQEADIEFASTKKGRRLAKLEQRVTARNIRKAKKKGTYDAEMGDPTAKYTSGGVGRRASDIKQRTFSKQEEAQDQGKLKMSQFLARKKEEKEASESTFKNREYKKIKEASNR
tara:strand:- start:54 stop:605 length:552 start_codon:yes stop_codon:yes gene_type:complete